MTPLSITLDIERDPWTDLKPGPDGTLTRIGLLRHGTVAGNATVGLLIELPDGTHIIGQTTWKLFRMAYVAMNASPIIAEEVIDP